MNFGSKGYSVIPNFLTEEELSCLRNECDSFVRKSSIERLLRSGCIIEPLSLWGETSNEVREEFDLFASTREGLSTDAATVVGLLAGRLAALAATFLKEDSIYLLNEQYVVKPSNSGNPSVFPWHTDGQYSPYLQDVNFVSCWIALDDTSEENGALVFRPLTSDSCAGDSVSALVEGTGKRKREVDGVVVSVNAGDLIMILPQVEHCSSANVTDSARRAFMPQYSAVAVRTKAGRPLSLAIPLDITH